MLFWKVVLTLGVSVSHNPLMPLETALLRGKGNSPRLGFAFSCSKNKAVPGLHQLVFQPCSVSLQPVLFQKSQNQTQGGMIHQLSQHGLSSWNGPTGSVLSPWMHFVFRGMRSKQDHSFSGLLPRRTIVSLRTPLSWKQIVAYNMFV